MQGDVFGWGQREAQAYVQVPQPSAGGGISRLNTATSGWDPWTKRAAVTGRSGPRRFWCWAWHDLAWWAAVQFIIGSYIFVAGSIAESFKAIDESQKLRPWVLTWPYAAASLMFTCGSGLLLYLSFQQYPDALDRQAVEDMDELTTHHQAGEQSPAVTKFMGKWTVARTAGGEAGLQALPRSESERQEVIARAYLDTPLLWRVADPQYRRRWWLDMSGSVVLFVGSSIYNISCAVDCVKAIMGGLPIVNFDVTWWCVTVPNLIGGISFVSGSWLYYAASTGTASLFNRQPSSTAWWIATLNFWGSAAFFVGAFCRWPLLQFAPDVLVPNWTEIFIGYFVGSAVMLIASHLMMMRIATDLAAQDAIIPVPDIDP